MAEQIIKTRFKSAYKTETEWITLDPVLNEGEVAYTSDKGNIYKVGNGTSSWLQLPYAIAVYAASAGDAATAAYATSAGDASYATSAGSVISGLTLTQNSSALLTDWNGSAAATVNFTDSDEKVAVTPTTAKTYIVGSGSSSATTAGLNLSTAVWVEKDLVDISGKLQQGVETTASAFYTHAEGQQTLASGPYSHAEGFLSQARGVGSHAEGYGTTALNPYSHAEGYQTSAYSTAVHSEGYQTTVNGEYSHAEGYQTRVNGKGSHAEGYANRISGNYSHAEGYQTSVTVNTTASHSEGIYTKASGNYSHAEGGRTTASGEGSHAEGYNTIAAVDYQHVSGKYNSTVEDALFIIGCGTANNARVNALVVTTAGDATFSSNVSASKFIGTATTAEFASSATNASSASNADYATNASSAVYATSAGRLSNTAAIGSATSPVYFTDAGVPTAIDLQASGVVTYDSNRLGGQEASHYATTALATTTNVGLMSAEDKVKLQYTNVAVATCPTAAATQSKVATVQDNTQWILETGSIVAVKYSYTNTAVQVTLNVNDTGAKSIYYNGAVLTANTDIVAGLANHYIYYIYDGTYWVWLGYDLEVTGGSDEKVATTPTTAKLYLTGSESSSATTAGLGLSTAVWVENDLTNVDSRLQQGANTTASGSYSHAEGYQTIASGEYSHAESYLTSASGDYSHAEGQKTTANGQYSHAEGNQTVASNAYSHAEGWRTTAMNRYDHAEGYTTNANGQVSHAEGYGTVTSGQYSHAEGVSTTAVGEGSHAEGFYTSASGKYSHAEGNQTTAQGECAHAEGAVGAAKGFGSHSEGFSCLAIVNYSHAEGRETYANGQYSHTEGWGTITTASYQHVSGTYNSTSSTDLFQIGNGTADNARSNIVEVSTSHLNVNGEYQVNGNPLLNIISNQYSSTSTYAVGDFCIYNSLLYKCNTAITTAEAWDSTHWTQTNVMAELVDGTNISY